MNYLRLLEESDRARWRISDIPWDEVDRGVVSPSLMELVREIALSELTTFSAAQKFFEQFPDDFDFTQWVTLWQFEETRHPHVLGRWLALFDVTIDREVALKARASQPLVKSRVATLTMNIISEMTAAGSYLNLYRATSEPVLRSIVKNLSGDEARHVSGFFTYAQREIERSARPDKERANVLRVLHMWMRRPEDVKHPVAMFHQRVAGDSELHQYVDVLGLGSDTIRAKICRMVGNLVGVDDLSPDGVLDTLGRFSQTRIAEFERPKVDARS